jgi:hypothetical protein
MILAPGDKVEILIGADLAAGKIVESTQYKDAYIIKYAVPTHWRKTPIVTGWKNFVISTFPHITNLPGIAGMTDPRLFQATAYLYWPDPQDKKRLHIWPCPISTTKHSIRHHDDYQGTARVWGSGDVLSAVPGTDADLYRLAQQRIDHIIKLQEIQNSMLELVPGTDKEVYLHKQWWR